MFSRSSTGAGPRDSTGDARKSAVPSIVSGDMCVTGDLSSDGEVQVDGQVTGDVSARTVLIGETGSVNGGVSADIVTVHGSVSGHIEARTVTLAKSARVVGDVIHESLAIDQGAYLEGHCKRLNQPAEEPEVAVSLISRDQSNDPLPDDGSSADAQGDEAATARQPASAAT